MMARDPITNSRLQRLVGQNRSAWFFVGMGAGVVVVSYIITQLFSGAARRIGPLGLVCEILAFLFFAITLAGVGIMALSPALSKRTINRLDPSAPPRPKPVGGRADQKPVHPVAGPTPDGPPATADPAVDQTPNKPRSARDAIGVTFAPTALIWGTLIGLGAGAATENFAVGIIVAIVVSALGWYVIQLFEAALARALLAGIASLAKWIETRNPRDAQMQAMRDRAARFVRSFDPTAERGDISSHQSLPQAGWYRDPSGVPGERYWDGQSWTGGTRPGQIQ